MSERRIYGAAELRAYRIEFFEVFLAVAKDMGWDNPLAALVTPPGQVLPAVVEARRFLAGAYAMQLAMNGPKILDQDWLTSRGLDPFRAARMELCTLKGERE